MCGIPTTSGDLSSFIFLLFVAIISKDTNNCPKLSVLSPSNLVTGRELIFYVVNTDLKCSFKISPFETRLKLCFHCCFPVVRPFFSNFLFTLYINVETRAGQGRKPLAPVLLPTLSLKHTFLKKSSKHLIFSLLLISW